MDENIHQYGQIYKIYCFSTDKEYVGSTCLLLEDRLHKHEKDFRSWILGTNKRYTSSFDILKNGNYDIELIENFPCENRRQLHEREAYYIKQSDKCVNKKLPYVPIEEQIRKQKIYDKIYGKIYRTKNRESLKIRNKNRPKYLCVCGGKISGSHKKRHERTKQHQRFINIV